jgi:phage protein D
MPLASGFVPGPSVTVNGTALTAAQLGRLVDLRVELAAGVPAQCWLRLDDPDFSLLDSGPFQVGAALVVSFHSAPSATVEVFNGEVVTLGVDQGAHERHELVAGAYDKSHRLARKTQVRTWQNKSYGDIVTQLAGEAGIGADVSMTPDPQHPYLVQTGTDADLLHQIADRTGCEWRVTAGKLVFKTRAAASSPVKVTFGEDLIRFRASYSAADQASKVTVRGWDPVKAAAIVSAKAPEDPTLNATTATLGSDSSTGASSAFTAADLQTGAVGVGNAQEAEVLAAGLAMRSTAATFTARGEILVNPALVPGGAVEVAGVGTKLSGTYRLSAVEHVFGSGQSAVTRFTVQGLEPTTLVDLLGPRTAAPEPWGHTGFVVGKVSNNNDPDGMGRVRVKFPTLSDKDESAWARLVGGGLGKERGLMMMPEIGDEVLVGFEHGDLRRPYVLGSLWNGTAKPPSTEFLNGENVVEWMLKTQGGMVLAFREGKSGEQPNFSVTLAKTGFKLYLGEDKVELWADQKPLQLKTGTSSLTFDGRGNIELKGTKITIAADNALEMSATQATLKASAKLGLEGASLEAKASATGKVESTGMLELKGSMLKIN